MCTQDDQYQNNKFVHCFTTQKKYLCSNIYVAEYTTNYDFYGKTLVYLLITLLIYKYIYGVILTSNRLYCNNH